nr:hypothetical protein [Candidatus Freyrarchaeum guaymaensis]
MDKAPQQGEGEIQTQSNGEDGLREDDTIHVQGWKTQNQHQTKQTIPRSRPSKVRLPAKDFDTISGLLLTENRLIINFKRKPRSVEPRGWASFDVNLANVTALTNGGVVRYDLRQLYHVHRIYEGEEEEVAEAIQAQAQDG